MFTFGEFHGCFRKILFFVIESRGCSKFFCHLKLVLGADGDQRNSSSYPGELDGSCAHPACSCVDEHRVSGLNISCDRKYRAILFILQLLHMVHTGTFHHDCLAQRPPHASCLAFFGEHTGSSLFLSLLVKVEITFFASY